MGSLLQAAVEEKLSKVMLVRELRFRQFLAECIRVGIVIAILRKQDPLERVCARCGTPRTDTVDSNICGSCADDLREENPDECVG